MCDELSVRVWCSVTAGVSGFSRPGSVQRDFWSPDPPPGSGAAARGRGGWGARSHPVSEEGGASPAWASDRADLRKTVSVDDRLLQSAGGEQRHLRLLSRLERGRKKLRNIHVSLFYVCVWFLVLALWRSFISNLLFLILNDST